MLLHALLFVRVLLTSGYPDAVIARHGLGGEPEVILGKPFRHTELARAVHAALRSSQA